MTSIVGNVALWAGLVTAQPEVSAIKTVGMAANIAGLYVSVSQLDYDVESNLLKTENIAPIVFSSWNDGAAWQQLKTQFLDDWAVLDLSPGLETLPLRVVGSVMQPIGDGLAGVGEQLEEWGEQWGRAAP